MLKSIVMHDIPMSDIAAMERWYYREHAAEIVGRYGPWLTRHESYMPVQIPEIAREYGFLNWRVTEGWWREIPEPGPKGTLAFSAPPVWPRVATCFVPAQPTEDFMGSNIQPHEKNILRWYMLIKYPEGISREEGDEWYLNIHAKEVMQQPKLFRFFSYQVIKENIQLPGTWAKGMTPPGDSILSGWDRLTELWYETINDWETSVIQSPPNYTRPTWATHNAYPFFEPQIDLVSSFLLERPADKFF